jgi:hypothetical protein
MKMWFLKLFTFTLIAFLTSCGADKLKTNLLRDQHEINSSKECSFISSGTPVCGADEKDYFNKDHAECFTTVKHTGHCVCSTSFMVCGSDGLDHNECEAVENQQYKIVKYSPCKSTEL